MEFLLLFITSSLFIGSIGAIFITRRNLLVQRIEKYIPHTGLDTSTNAGILVDEQTPSFKKLFEAFSKQFKGKRITEKWKQQIEESGIPLKPEEFLAIRILSLSSAIFTVFVLNMNLFLSILLPLVGWLYPIYYLKSKRQKRILTCSGQLPQALGTLGTALRSGFSFMQAMQMVAKEVGDPLGSEFEKTIREINLGISMEAAFQNLLQRLPNKDLKLVVSAVIIQRSTGGNLAKLFETIEETINERVRIKEELKTLTSQGRMSAWIISLLPVVLGIILNLMSPEYFAPMIHHPLGIVLLVLGCLSGLIGWMVIQKIVRIEV